MWKGLRLMNRNIECEIIRDLLPSYIEKVTSNETNEAVEEHLDTCNTCKKYYENMTKDINIEKVEDEKEIKDMLKKAKTMYVLKGIFFAACLLSIVVPFIVNLSVDHRLTWFYIVLGGCGITYSVLGIILFVEENKLRYVLTVISIITLPYLYIIQYICNKYYLENENFWFKNIGIPLSIIWLVVIWISYFVYVRTNRSLFYSIGTLCICSAAGSLCTDYLLLAYGLSSNRVEDIIINCIIYIGAGILLYVFGIIKRSKK